MLLARRWTNSPVPSRMGPVRRMPISALQSHRIRSHAMQNHHLHRSTRKMAPHPYQMESLLSLIWSLQRKSFSPAMVAQDRTQLSHHKTKVATELPVNRVQLLLIQSSWSPLSTETFESGTNDSLTRSLASPHGTHHRGALVPAGHLMATTSTLAAVMGLSTNTVCITACTHLRGC